MLCQVTCIQKYVLQQNKKKTEKNNSTVKLITVGETTTKLLFPSIQQTLWEE